ncbi:MAG TPA: maleylpyruvate isomerase family mycothiol-dependent enzyme [Candidatus Dormibacteraeota bacterium]|jgi:uncharacterized protein (TIGR03083 family)|nr:maleylpyruvate isomerase family mycothiol-dependent enzyme [Candidatus Dormibacteraeota bacterium]
MSADEPTRLSDDEYVEAVRSEGGRIADLAERSGLSTPVPTCPGFDIAGLVGHLGRIQRWATIMIADGRTTPVGSEERRRRVGASPKGPEVLPWFREGLARLVDTLHAAPLDLEVWSFLPAPTPRGFWIRRMAHEVLIHRADVELAVGAPIVIEPRLAADGIDELLTAWVVDPATGPHFERAATLLVQPDDADARWLASLGPDGARTSRGVGAADCTISGPAGALDLMLWNRRAPGMVDISGDAAVIDAWAAAVRI